MKRRKILTVNASTVAVALAFCAVAGSASAQSPSGGQFLERKAGDGFTLLTRGGELSVYGNIDLSLDDTTKGISKMSSGGTTPAGNTETNSNTSNNVKGGLTSRNTFIGLAGSDWGALKIGKSDAPYKTSTGRMNPFLGMIGDYSVIMGNTGGDNRVEFGTRVDHAIWYESPNFDGMTFNVLLSPGQNRASDSSNIPAGESDCAGGNIPGSGAL